MLNVLFVLYHDFTANSAAQVFHWANELSALGVSCSVAVPNNPDTVRMIGKPEFSVHDFESLLNQAAFPNGRGPDVVHAWTPREIVRSFCERLRAIKRFRLFIHLEDNEHHLLSTALARPLKAMASLSRDDLDSLVPNHLSHPIRAAEFLQSAQGVTVLMDRLCELVPANIATLEVWPAAAKGFLVQRPINYGLRRKFGIPQDTTVLVYTGNVHAANAREVRSLYLAVAILNREGHPAALVRAGKDFHPFLGPDETWARKHSFELGYVPHRDIPDVLAAADVLVQPGKPDAFNDYRFPSKLPEFLAMGRPIILPKSNVGLHMTHGLHGYILPKVDALAIAGTVVEITRNQELYDRLCCGARQFFQEHFSWGKGARALLNFYQEAELFLGTHPNSTQAPAVPVR